MSKGVTPESRRVKPCYRRKSVRFVLLALFAVGCQNGGGAVNVRWEIVDLTTGAIISPLDVNMGGSCVKTQPSPWRIDSVRLELMRILDGGGGAPYLDMDPRLSFDCAQREATTPFVIDPGEYSMSLATESSDGEEAVTPAPAVRTVHRGDVVNLDVVELGVHPLPLASPDLGAPDLAIPDAGPVR